MDGWMWMRDLFGIALPCVNQTLLSTVPFPRLIHNKKHTLPPVNRLLFQSFYFLFQLFYVFVLITCREKQQETLPSPARTTTSSSGSTTFPNQTKYNIDIPRRPSDAESCANTTHRPPAQLALPKSSTSTVPTLQMYLTSFHTLPTQRHSTESSLINCAPLLLICSYPL